MNSPKVTYIVDMLNVFSDFRETYYKRQNVDFHSVKYQNLHKDSYIFFDVFFNDYLKLTGIKKTSRFVFVSKRINHYDDVLANVISKYREFDIKFILVTDKYQDLIIDNNKDDFLCQYLLTVYSNSVLISNDNYKNNKEYTELFLKLKRVNVQVMSICKGSILNTNTLFLIDKQVIEYIHSTKFSRKCLSKGSFTQLHAGNQSLETCN
jgi:hypothetical protein